MIDESIEKCKLCSLHLQMLWLVARLLQYVVVFLLLVGRP